MKKKIRNILQNIYQIKFINDKVIKIDSKIEDIYSFNILQPLISNNPFLAFNSGAMRPLGLAFMLNEIAINKRDFILEFGLGISTIMMARLAKENKLNLKIYSVEHDPNWVDIINKQLIYEGIESYVTIITAELSHNKSNIDWYNEIKINEIIKNIKFDLIIIDGPPAYSESLQLSRFPVNEYLEGKLNHTFCILIDDTNRVGEKKLANVLKTKFSVLQEISVGDSMTAIYKGNFFNSNPF